MAKIPVTSGRNAQKAFERLGWIKVRQHGSHIIMNKPGEIASLSIPDHSEVAKGTLRGVIRTAGLSVEEFSDAL